MNYAATYGPTLNDTHALNRVSFRVDSLFGMSTSSMIAVAGMVSRVFADVGESIASGLGSAWALMKTIGLPIAGIAAVMCAFYIFTGGEKGMEKAKKIGLYLVIGLAVLYLGPWLIETASGWFSESGDATTIFGGG